MPSPRSFAVQRMSLSVHFTGIVFAWLIPLPFGPRKRAHSSAEMSPTNKKTGIANKLQQNQRLSFTGHSPLGLVVMVIAVSSFSCPVRRADHRAAA
jgi:hypothetical protein